ncbi:hypothetical protein Tco_1109093 [Tanacetum coccineum]
MFIPKGKIIATSESECQPDCSKGDNACISNPQEPINKRFPSSTFSMTVFNTLSSWHFSRYDSHDVDDRVGKSIRSFVRPKFSNGENHVVSKSSAVTTADASNKRQ